MKRQEEIIEAANQRTIEIFGELDDFQDRTEGFIDGAKWADKTMINKACTWLENILYIHTEINEDKDFGEMSITNWVTSDYDSVEEFIHRFRKAMEE